MITVTEPVSFDIPAVSKRGGKSVYKFDALTEVGMSFGVSGHDIRLVRASVSTENKKFKTVVKNESGKVVMDGDKPKMTFNKHFEVIKVDDDLAAAIKGTPLEGSTVIVRRDI